MKNLKKEKKALIKIQKRKQYQNQPQEEKKEKDLDLKVKKKRKKKMKKKNKIYKKELQSQHQQKVINQLHQNQLVVQVQNLAEQKN